ncbi:MAG TPA: translocation/assembly module TamB domain-containing protein [Steroidobacteraceae bacterium]|nr:translocation/assembly module TamB domain-containing protein [Steroidobacteraceae bacterium]
MIRLLTLRRLLLALASLLVVAVIVAPLTLLWAVLYTESGAQFVVRHLPRQLGPVQLVIEGFSGTVAHGLHVERVQVEHELVHLEFTDLHARLEVAPLLMQKIRVRYASLAHAEVQVKRRVHPSTPSPPMFLPRWLQIGAEEAHVRSVHLSVYNGFQMQVSDIVSSAVLRHLDIRFYSIDAQLAQAHVTGAGSLRALDPLGLEFKGHLDWHPEGQPAYVLDGSARGDLNTLNLVAHTHSPFRVDLSGQLRDLTSHFNWVASAQVRQFELAAWNVGGPFGSISGHLSGSGDAATFSAQGTLDPAGLRTGAFAVQFTGGYANHVLSAQSMEARHLSSGARARASGTIAVVEHGPRLELQGSWEQFRWPLLARAPVVRSERGSFSLTGVLPYQVRFSADLRALELPVMPADITGTLDKDSFSFERADVDLYGGHTRASGRVSWAADESYQVSGHASGIDSAQLRADLPGSVSFDYSVSGQGFSPAGAFKAAFSSLSGKVRGAAASGSGAFAHSGKTWTFNALHVGLGSAELALDGQLSDRMNLRYTLRTQDLSLLNPGSRGRIHATGTLGGTLEAPEIIGTAHALGIDYQGIKLESADAEVDFEPDATGKDSKIDARLHNLSFGQRRIEAATLSLTGPPENYLLHLTASAPGLSASTAARGNFAHATFQGQLTALSLVGNDTLHLGLDRPVDLLLSARHVRIEWLCLVGTPGSVCADGEWQPTQWNSTVMSNELPLATLTAGMTPAVQYQGTVSALARLSGSPTTPLQGTLRAQLSDAVIAHRLASRKIEHTRIGSGNADLVLGPQLATLQADLGDGQVGTLHGTLNVRRSTASWLDMPISGELHAQSAEMGLLSLYVSEIDRAAGHFNADLGIGGTLGGPTFNGLLKVSEGEIDVYQVNLALRAINLESHLSEGGIDFKGAANVGAGSVSAGGHMEWHGLQPYGKFHLQGTNLRVADIPEAQIDASPDLDFAVAGRRIEVTGTVLVPYAKIQPKDITNAVRASDDEVIVGSEPDDPSKRFEVVSTVTLTLGKNISVDAFGLSAKLGGSMVIRSGYDPVTRASGSLNVVEGRYAAYGRLLDIDYGQLNFTNGPIENPAVTLRAKKEFPDVTAYVTVRGTLLQPRMSFSSVPPLPQSQIVSLILAGGSLESAQGHGGNVAVGQGVAMLAQQYGSIFGIQEAGLESDVNNETSVVLGRYLNPRLYVSYGISLTEQLNTFKARYTLGDHWTLKAEVGQAYGTDLVYTITTR